MFIGTHYHNLESKGRLAIPAPFRKELQSGGILTRGLDGCLFLFPASYWNTLSEKLALLPLTNQKARNFTRLLVQSAATLDLDSQGRTLISEKLRQTINLKKHTVIAGALTRVEIWDQDTYHQHIDVIEKQSDEIENSLSDLGI